MESTNGIARKQAGGVVLALLVGLGLGVGCGGEQPLGLSDSIDATTAQNAAGGRSPPKATGTVQIEWPGGKGRVVPPGEEKLAFAEFEAFPATAKKPARGSFTYRVLNADFTPHREIVAIVTEAVVDVDQSKAWFIGQVVSDTRICSGGGCDGHDDGTHDDGGCSDGTHDDGTHDDGGCSDGTHDDGTHDDGGCSGGGGDTTHGGAGISGKDPRVGQIVVVKVHDLGTPATNGDGIGWKWLAPGTLVDLGVEPKCMCKKEIVGGNLVVHPSK